MKHPLTIDRRGVIRGLAGSAALLAAPALAQAKPRVVVIGGGPGGATVAKYLKHGGDQLDVSLVEINRTYVTPFTSNLYLGGLKDFQSLTFGYDALAARGVRMVFDAVTAIDRDAKMVRTAGGAALPYDRLVISPGIDFRWDAVPGYSPEVALRMPHGYRGGAQFKLLKQQLDAVGDGGLIVIIAPPNPYRCPPAPYERASMMAYALKTRGVKNARIVILDAKDHFAMQTLFIDGWQRHYNGMIEWQDPTIHGGIKAIDPKAMTVTTDFETHKATMVNVIPPQIAGVLARDSGLADDSGFCPVDAGNMRSRIDSQIHVIGDSAGGEFPKSGFAANNEAKITAMMIRADLAGDRRMPVRFTNHCWSTIAPHDAFKNGARYEPRDGRIVMLDPYTSQLEESPEQRAKQAQEAAGWYVGMTTDIFG
ncbi:MULTISPECIES: NAD(P)/FAD-dependent oxidoreductase [Rhodopseudomonas]|uniref:NAD(P)/FAD-dependent oxidoreductase n=1 Tax=Rhodopseudomonas TaxID=1073 RepID=UPI000AFBD8E8|nr:MULTISPECIES: NAD(P)/FAD-dependent oxidoreductase [Rhodopseudomonas]MDF3814385.1 NAD(P)/FAD-dependent oxidoreductase [Rhodopseudomonas sp. BAL398]WOK17344.1 NAD(P)/FAD-dependent oxidoreductase [Rhodopseudomonas sp. BAL398]